MNRRRRGCGKAGNAQRFPRGRSHRLFHSLLRRRWRVQTPPVSGIPDCCAAALRCTAPATRRSSAVLQTSSQTSSRPTSAAVRPASICLSAPIISTSLYFLCAMPPRLSARRKVRKSYMLLRGSGGEGQLQSTSTTPNAAAFARTPWRAGASIFYAICGDSKLRRSRQRSFARLLPLRRRDQLTVLSRFCRPCLLRRRSPLPTSDTRSAILSRIEGIQTRPLLDSLTTHTSILRFSNGVIAAGRSNSLGRKPRSC